MKAMGSDLLVFSDTEVSTHITRLSGEELYIAATARLDFGLTRITRPTGHGKRPELF